MVKALCVVPECGTVLDLDEMAVHVRSVHSPDSSGKILPWWYHSKDQLNGHKEDVLAAEKVKYRKGMEFASFSRKRYLDSVDNADVSGVYKMLFGRPDAEQVSQIEAGISAIAKSDELHDSGNHETFKRMKLSSILDSDQGNGAQNVASINVKQETKWQPESAEQRQSQQQEQHQQQHENEQYDKEQQLSPQDSSRLFKQRVVLDLKAELANLKEAPKSLIGDLQQYTTLKKEYEWSLEVSQVLHQSLADLVKQQEDLFRKKEMLLNANIKLEFDAMEKDASEFIV